MFSGIWPLTLALAHLPLGTSRRSLTPLGPSSPSWHLHGDPEPERAWILHPQALLAHQRGRQLLGQRQRACPPTCPPMHLPLGPSLPSLPLGPSSPSSRPWPSLPPSGPSLQPSL